VKPECRSAISTATTSSPTRSAAYGRAWPGNLYHLSVLRAKINAQQDKISSLDETIRRLKRDLEIAHGEIIKLRSQRRHDSS
jgi:hypothetical protein